MDVDWDIILRILGAFGAGILLGYEREYNNKPAGLRTIVLITVGSCLFSLLNLTLDSTSPDRIASTVVTGVGFVGGGVIFKEGLNVRGITTAATIWVAAAIGMAFGFGQYFVAIFTLMLVLITLVLLAFIEGKINSKQARKKLKFTFSSDEYSIHKLEADLARLKINFRRTNLIKTQNELTAEYNVRLQLQDYPQILAFFLKKDEIANYHELELEIEG